MDVDNHFEVKDKLMNKMLVILAVIIFPAIVVSVLRTIQTGWQPAFLVQICLVPIVVLLAFFRKSIPLNVKASFLIVICFIVAVFGFLQFSISSSGIQYLMLGVLVAVVFMSNRIAVWVYVAGAVTIVAVWVLTTEGIIAPSIDLSDYYTYSSTWANNFVTFITILGLMIILVGNIGQLLNSKLIDLKRKNDELQMALSEIKTLRGIIPICSFCKKVRDDKGYWNQVDIYLREHSEADFSHGVCPECKKIHYAGLVNKRADDTVL